MMEETFQAFPEHAPVSVVETPFSVAEMRFLYERADCLVSASRGEGFGLPVAEAMWLGRPVIATIHSGQADLCTPGNCWPVAFELKGAKSHLSHPLSYWAEPSPESIQEQMRSVFAARPAERDARSKAAQRHIRTSFTWNGVAARHLLACQSVERRKGPSTSGWRASEAAKRISVAFVSSWNTPCGIAEYTRLLVERLEKKIECHMFANRTEQTIGPDGDNVIRCWPLGSYSETPLSAYQPLLDALLASDVSVISIQFNFAFFPAHILEFLTGQLTGAGRRVIVTLHATDGPDFDRIARALRRIDLCLVHRKSDLEHLVADYQLDNAVLLDHGIVAPSVPAAPAIAELRRRSEFVVGSFGFCLPLKGLYELILAVALARKLNWRIRLKLLNALYPVRDSEAYAQTCVSLVKELDLGGCVEMCTEFLDETTIFRELATTDLIVLPYVASTESCSGAVRYPLASLKPVLCTDLAVFEDLAGIVHQVPAGNVMALAMKLVELSQDLKQLSRYSEAQAAHVQQYSWRTVAAQFQQLIEALQADVDQTAAMKASPPDAFDSVFSKAVPARHAL
jgi:glycosyltransferase involved in cell wall biosynthesis